MAETKKDFLTPIMRTFVQHNVNRGYSMSEDEYLRFLVGQEIKRWEKMRMRAYTGWDL